MAGGLVGLLDDVAALAKLAAASIDDIGAAAGRASVKAAGVVVDDTAVTPGYVRGLAAERELPIIRKIATGSLRNKLLFILPVAIVLSEVAPKLVEIILMAGGAFLCYEGAHKVVHALRGDDHDHDVPVTMLGPDAEKATVAGAIRTDFILSAEIMVISLKEVIDEPFVTRGVILAVVALLITVVVYGVVAAIVKMDDVGLVLIRRPQQRAQRMGRALVRAMPVLMRWLSTIGIAAMLWVGGHILLVGADELGWHGPYDLVHDLEGVVHDAGSLSGVLEWIVNTAASAVVGLAVGLLVTAAVAKLPKRDRAPRTDWRITRTVRLMVPAPSDDGQPEEADAAHRSAGDRPGPADVGRGAGVHTPASSSCHAASRRPPRARRQGRPGRDPGRRARRPRRAVQQDLTPEPIDGGSTTRLAAGHR